MKRSLWIVAAFACSGPQSEAPQFIAGPLAVGVQPRQATISWASDVAASAVVTLTPTAGAPVQVQVGEAAAHDVVVPNLTPNTDYNAKIILTANGVSTEANLSLRTLDEAPDFFRILFDAAHGEDAGNADWVVDDGTALPNPAVPQSETDWNGTISSWGFDLFVTGRYGIETLPEGRTLTLNNAQNPQDLSNYDALVLPEPNQRLSAAERSAVISYVSQGGGLIIVANHDGADRDNDGFDAVQIMNELMDVNGQNFFGVRFDPVDIVDDPLGNIDPAPGVPVIRGIFGDVNVIGINNGSTMTLTPGGPARAIAWRDGVPQGLTEVVAAVSSFGAGKVFLIGDSSPFEDGTGRPGNKIFDSWHVASQDNAALFLNAIAFVVGDDG